MEAGFMIDLESCAELLRDSPHRLALLNAWLGWRGDDLVPAVVAIKAEDLGSALGYVSVLEVQSPDRAIFRLAGAWYDEVADRDLVGENYNDLIVEERRSTSRERIWNKASVPCGAVALSKLVRPSGQEVLVRGLMLPVNPSTPQEPMKIYAAVDVLAKASQGAGDNISEYAAAYEFDYVDIGHGAVE